jgi:hypothetical protein
MARSALFLAVLGWTLACAGSVPPADPAPAAPVPVEAPAPVEAAPPQEAGAPPDPYVDEGVCPGECCTYRTWTARTAAPLLDAPGGARIGEIALAEQVEATTGQVRTKPVRARVLRDHALEPVGGDGPEREVHAGDIVWILTHVGEGYARLWFDGAVWQGEVLNAYGDACAPGAKPSEDCWLYAGGEPVEQIWWARVTRSDGSSGWVDNTHDVLDGFDACG